MTTPPDPLPAAPRSSRSRWLLVAGAAVISVLLASNGVTLWMLTAADSPPVAAPTAGSGSERHEPADDPRPAEGEVVRLDPMTTTVGGPTVRHARLTMALVLVEGVDPQRIEGRVPLLQDALLLELSTMSGEQLHRTEGARALRERMTGHAHDIWDDEVVSRVVFTELVIP